MKILKKILVTFAFVGQVMLAAMSSASTVHPSPEERIIARGISTEISSLITLVADVQADIEIRYFAAIALGGTKNETALPVLLSALKDPHEDIQYGALIGLRELGSEQAIPSLLETLESDSSDHLKLLSISALARFDQEGAAEGVVDAALDSSQSSEVRGEAIRAIEDSWPNAADKKEFHELLKDENKKIRAFASIAIARLGNEIAVPYLAETILDPEIKDPLRARAINQLETLTKQDFGLLVTIGSADGQPIRDFDSSNPNRSDSLERLAQWWANNQEKYRTIID